MVGIWVEAGYWPKLNLSGLYLFGTQVEAESWQVDQLVEAGQVECDGEGYLYQDEWFCNWLEVLEAVRDDYRGEVSFFRIMEVQQGVVHAA